MRIAVIGGGASGLISSIYAKNETNDVIILERNQSLGKKILMTGNGRCNYWNEDFTKEHFYTNDLTRLEKVLTPENKKEINDFFKGIGIVPKIKDGYYYPYANQAINVLEALLRKAKKVGVKIISNFYVESIEKQNHRFIINQSLEFEQVIIATGGSSAPFTGSDGNGYRLAEKFHHTICKPLPALVQLISRGSFLKEWAGVRSEVSLKLFANDDLVKEEKGEIQLTGYGVSGICVFNLSRYVTLGLSQNKKMCLKINFMPFTNDAETWLERQSNYVKDMSVIELLEGFLNKKLENIILERCKMSSNKKYLELKKEEKAKLQQSLTSFEISIVGTKGFQESQVTCGGVSFEEINPVNMESEKIKGLYFVGEIIDVDGDCGGYNLGFAWLSGMLAGKDVSKRMSSCIE